ncbi:MAG: winged helix-turn-helix transcriptional regulator [Candidatus Aenigmarchaeota archaeon]|nr:winged helix-turn-helix transcriptional regulator [Candidatus Aenigmarchaeota archaeon]
MEISNLKSIGLTENEIKIYLLLLKSGSITAYEISQKTGIYRAHVYDKLEQLIKKGLVTHVYKGAKKYFHATEPSKIRQYVEDKKNELEIQEECVEKMLPELEAMTKLPRENIRVEVFKGPEGLKYIHKGIIKARREVLITGIDDGKYSENLPIFMKQYFRELRRYGIRERVITAKKKGIFLFRKKIAPTTTYRFLEEKQFNPTNTFVYGNKVVIVSWSTPVTAIMIENNEIAETYRNHFEHLWKIASTKNE